MEENSRLERLTEFKGIFKKACDAFTALLHRVKTERSKAEEDDFLFAFFPFMFGVYPYTHTTDKQFSAMKAAGIDFSPRSVYDVVYGFIVKALK